MRPRGAAGKARADCEITNLTKPDRERTGVRRRPRVLIVSPVFWHDNREARERRSKSVDKNVLLSFDRHCPVYLVLFNVSSEISRPRFNGELLLLLRCAKFDRSYALYLRFRMFRETKEERHDNPVAQIARSRR